MGRPCDGADGRALAVYVINPDLGVFDQLLCFDPSLIQSHWEVNLKLAFKGQQRFHPFGDGRDSRNRQQILYKAVRPIRHLI